MSTPASPKRPHNDENSVPHSAYHHHHNHTQTHTHNPHSQQQLHRRDTLTPIAPSPSPRPRQPLAPFEHPPNLFSSGRYASTPGHSGRAPLNGSSNSPAPVAGGGALTNGGAGGDATPVRSHATKVNPEARQLPLPKGLGFAAPPPPATALLPHPTPPHPRSVSHHTPLQRIHGEGRASGGNSHPNSLPSHMTQTPRQMHMSPIHHSTPIGRSLAMSSFSSPSSMSHMPSTPDICGSPYPPGPIDLHDLLPPARFPGALPQAFLSQGEMPGGQSTANDNDDKASVTADNATPSTARRTLVSCNPWDYRPEDHGKNKPRRRFSPGELDMLEILWRISHNPHKWQRQKLARWFGCTTRHLTVWFQNRRQDVKKNETAVKQENNPDTASRAFAAVQRANRGDRQKYSPEQAQVIMDIVSDRLLPDMWFAQQPSGSATPPAKTTPPPPPATAPAERRLPFLTPAPPAIAPKPYPGLHQGSHSFPLKPIRRGFSLDDVCVDREQSMTHRASPRPRAPVEGFEQMNKNDPRYREALVNMLPSELSSDAIEPPEDDDDSLADEDSPTRKRARHNPTSMRAPRPTLPPVIGLGRPPTGHRSRSSFGRASSSDVLACSSRARYLVNNSSVMTPSRSVTDPVGGRSISAGPLPRVPEHSRGPSAVGRSGPGPVLPPINDRKRKIGRQGSWSNVPSIRHKDSFDRSGPAPIHEDSSPVPDQTRSPTPTPTDAESISPKTAPGSVDTKPVDTASTPGGSGKERRLPLPEGRSIYSFSTELEPETKRGSREMDENVISGAQALMELLSGGPR